MLELSVFDIKKMERFVRLKWLPSPEGYSLLLHAFLLTLYPKHYVSRTPSKVCLFCDSTPLLTPTAFKRLIRHFRALAVWNPLCLHLSFDPDRFRTLLKPSCLHSSLQQEVPSYKPLSIYDISLDTDSVQRLTGPTISVVVGKEQETEEFGVHEALIRSSSPFFEKALTGPWTEASQRLVKLPEDKPKAFSLYINWLYYRKIPAYSEISTTDYDNLFDAYILAEKLLDTQFHNAVINAVVERSQNTVTCVAPKFPASLAIHHAFNNTESSAPIRRLLVDMYANNGSGAWLRDPYSPQDFPQSFLLMLASSVMDQRTVPRDKLVCTHYHHPKASQKRKRSSSPKWRLHSWMLLGDNLVFHCHLK